MKITDLFIYPLKSARGIRLETAGVELAGLAGDRQLLLVDPGGRFITQRELPALARLNVEMREGRASFQLDGAGGFETSLIVSTERQDITIWKSTVNAAVAEDTANRQLSEWFGRDVKLVFFDAAASRRASPEWAGDDAPVRFPDGYPILITTTGSLRALNENMTEHGDGGVGMERFRPNIVIETDAPWLEDTWASIEISGLRLDLVKPCSRCIITSQDQMNGSREGVSPIPAMQRMRMSSDRRVPGYLFGWNAVPRGGGPLKIGEEVKVIENRPEGWPLRPHPDAGS